jgi:DNA modification methylase
MADRIHRGEQGSEVYSQTGERSRLSVEKRLRVRLIPLTELKPDARNPRIHPRRQIRQIARSIETFGFVVPVLADAYGNLLAGHGRIAAAKLLGWTDVPGISIDHLTEAQARAFMIADNRLTENSMWDERLLAQHLKDLSLLELDFSLEVTGFEMGEIDLRIEGLNSQADTSGDPADDLPAEPSEPPVTRVGDLWLLGPHRLYCGSAIEDGAYAALMQGDKAAAVFTDPPYNVPIQGNVSGLGAVHHREFVMGSGEMSEAEFTAFLHRAFSACRRNTRDGSLHFICIDWRHMSEVLTAGRHVYSELKNLCVWVKSNGGMGSLYRSQHELVFVFKQSRGSHRNNVQLGQYGRNRTNVWQYPGTNSFSRGSDGEEGKLLALHPTVKPVAMVADAIMDCTARGDIVLDAFLGSGTTIIAAERTGRHCYGLELDPAYVDLLITRFQDFTGKRAVHGETSLSFAEMRRERATAERSSKET